MPSFRSVLFNTVAVGAAFGVSLVVPEQAQAQTSSDTTTTTRIVSDTIAAAPSCAAWRVSGTCFWLRCTYWKCSVRTSMRVSHFNPDAVVSTFHDDTTHPWTDWGGTLARNLRPAAAGLLGLPVDSAGTVTSPDRRDQSRLYRDADVIGHPVSLLAMLASSSNSSGYTMLCPTEARAFQPYFSSYTDALAWRAVLPVESWYSAARVPGQREIGTWPQNSWSGLYPRDGNVTQQHPVKGAAVLSQRAGDITTRSGQPHVYLQLPTGGRRMVDNVMLWLPPPLVENDATTGTWQMLAPSPQRSCEVFGANDSVQPVSWGDNRTSGTGGYAFNLWRPYSCCSRAGQVFLGAVIF